MTVSHMPTTHRTTRNANRSPLLRLPRELRNLIFDFLFNGLTIQVLHGLKTLPVYRSGTWARQPFYVHNLVEITTVCRQIRAETSLLPFQRSEFFFSSWKSLAHMARKLTSQQQEAVRTARMSIVAPFDRHKVEDAGLRFFTGLDRFTISMLPDAYLRSSMELVQSGYREGIRRAVGRDVEVLFH
jgi:hypothetical protein